MFCKLLSERLGVSASSLTPRYIHNCTSIVFGLIWLYMGLTGVAWTIGKVSKTSKPKPKPKPSQSK